MKYKAGDMFDYDGVTYIVIEIEEKSHNGLGRGYYVCEVGEADYLTEEEVG